MFEYILTSASLMFLSITMLGVIRLAWRESRKIFHVQIVVDLIFFFVITKIVIYYLLPTLLRIYSNYQFELEDNVPIYNLVYLYFIELVSWTVWIMALLFVFKIVSKNRNKLDFGEFFHQGYLESKIILIVLALGFVVIQILTLTETGFGPFFEIFKALFFYAGLASGPFLMIISLRYFGKSLFVLGVLSSLFSLLSLSTRGALVYLLLFCIFLVWFVLQDRRAKFIVVSICCVILVSYFTFGGLFSGSLFLDESGNVIVNTGVDLDKKGDRSTLEEIEWRFGAATRMGTAFINLYDRGKAAGINPIKHSIMGFLPRSLTPNKPYPSTLNGDDLYSQGMYIIYREIHGYNTFSMVEFPTGAHFYWEFGLVGVVILSAISGLYVALCAHFFSKLGFVALPLMVAVFKPWGYVDPKIWVSDIAMQMYQIILPLILMVFIIRFVRSVLDSANKSAYSTKNNRRLWSRS